MQRLATLALGTLIACAATGNTSPATGKARQPGGGQVRHAEDLFVVDCLLPAPIRRLGRHAQTLGPRRAIRAPAFECGMRGGEYSENRGDYGFALQVWLPQAEAGDATAQTYVGEILEKGEERGHRTTSRRRRGTAEPPRKASAGRR